MMRTKSTRVSDASEIQMRQDTPNVSLSDSTLSDKDKKKLEMILERHKESLKLLSR